MVRKFSLIFILLCLSSLVFSGPYDKHKNLSASEILQEINNLRSTKKILYIAAHPDDENTRLISYLRNYKGVEVAYLSLTRGDGGQNLIGDEAGIPLGLIRTQELVEARKVDGGNQFFTRAVDFGYSKTPEETLNIWKKDKVLEDIVFVIRQFQPDIIITRFSPETQRTHGHHTASAMLAVEAFEKAANKNEYPNQLKTVGVHTTKSIFWNTSSFFFGKDFKEEDFAKLEVGEYSSLTGISNGEMAAISRSKHQSQGFGSELNRNTISEYFKALASSKNADFNLQNPENSWNAEYQKLLSQILTNYDVNNAYKSVPLLIQLKSYIEKASPNTHAYLIQRVETLIAQSLGIWLDAQSNKPYVCFGDTLSINSKIIQRTGLAIENLKFDLLLNDNVVLTKNLKSLPLGQVNSQNFVYVHKQKTSFADYWYSNSSQKGLFDIENEWTRILPEKRPMLHVHVQFEINGVAISYKVPVQYFTVEPSKGEKREPIVDLPLAAINPELGLEMMKNGETRKIKVKVELFSNHFKGNVIAKVGSGFELSWTKMPIELNNKGTIKELELVVKSTIANSNSNIDFELVDESGNVFSKYPKRIRYEHIEDQYQYLPSSIKVVSFDYKLPKGEVLLISGAGEQTYNCLKNIGLNIKEVSADAFLDLNISTYASIIVGIRLFNTAENADVIHTKLLNYVENGGKVLCQYQTTSSFKLKEFGPYSLEIGRDRVTEEEAEVKLLAPANVALNIPNKIGAVDFDNWVQERGLYFAKSYSDKYIPLFEMKDSNEEVLRGSTLISKFGKGKFTYTGLSFFRQLPAGVPGAYRLLLNLL